MNSAELLLRGYRASSLKFPWCLTVSADPYV